MEKKVLIVAADFVAETAKVVAGQFGINLTDDFEMMVAAIAAATLIYWMVKFALAIPVVKHLVAAGMAFCLAEAVLSTVELFHVGLGITPAQIFGVSLAFAGICLVLSIRSARLVARELSWTRPKKVVVAETSLTRDGEVTEEYEVTEPAAKPTAEERLVVLERELEKMIRLLRAQHGPESEPELFDSSSK